MEDNIKIAELNKNQTKRILNILENFKTKNLYLLEGIISENPNNKNLLFYRENELISIIHLKHNRYIHIQCFTKNRLLNLEVGRKLKLMFPNIKSIFGDKESLNFFNDVYFNKINKSFEYIYMELPKENFKHSNYFTPLNLSNISFEITVESYPEILLLQISYQVEELGIDPLKIKKEILEKLIELRIKRNEMTVLKIKKRPIGIAAINAKYKDICQIGSVYIDKNYRGKGYASILLLEHFKKLFRIYRKVVLFVRKDNQIAFNLYKKLGFSVKGELEQILLKTG